ncbi:MAG: hypothetical protein AB7D06_04315 [Pedobacter sp.]
MNAKRMVLIGLISISLAYGTLQTASANTGDFAIGVGPGTLGISADTTVGISSHLNARVGISAFNFDLKTTQNDIAYDLDVRLLSFPILLDWHPFSHRGFRISTGLVINKNKANVAATSQSTYTIGDTEYTSSELGDLSGKLTFNTLAPYLGLGWGNSEKNPHWSFVCDLGVVFQGKTDLSLKASGPIASDLDFQAELEQERRELEDDLDSYRYYPVISMGVSYKF